MIHEITANKDGFHSVTFESGLNLVLADVTPASGEKDTRNGVGKTSLIEIIHFCLGSAPRRGDTLKDPMLGDWTFSMTFDLGSAVASVVRSLAKPRHVTLRVGERPRELSLPEWTDLLGQELFDLPPRAADDAVGPSFRSLISYVARRERSAYDHPFDHHPRQHAWDRQVNMAYLLGLGWRDAASFEMLRRRKKWLDAEKAVSKAEQLASEQPAARDTRPRQRGRLDADRVRLEEAVRALEQDLAAFRVHPEYRRIEDEANALTRELQALSNENVSDKNLLAYYERAAVSEQPPEEHETLELFAAAKVELPGAVKRELGDLRKFHAALIANRREFVASEMEEIGRRIAERDRKAEGVVGERADRLAILASHGALDEYTRMQSRLSERREQLSRTVSQLAALDRIENGARALRLDAQGAYDAAKVVHEERHVQRERAISLFNAYSQFLYEEPGNLILDVRQTKNMPTFEFGVEIVRSKATGIEHMKTLCLDLTIAALWADRPRRPGFVIHDSTLFEAVDERQKARALALVEREARERNYQYVLTLNTDQLKGAIPPGFDPSRYERLRLADEPAAGSLFGVRF